MWSMDGNSRVKCGSYLLSNTDLKTLQANWPAAHVKFMTAAGCNQPGWLNDEVCI